MDISWYWKFPILAAVFSALAVICTISMFFVENLKKEGNKCLIIAINCWLLINIGAMVVELYDVSYSTKDLILLFNLILSLGGIVSLALLVLSNKLMLSNFKRL